MTIKEFKDKLAEEIRNKLRKNNLSTPILDRLELHVKDFEDVSVQDIIGSKNMRHDVYVSFIYQICYPSRIKMDIDENYQPIKNRRIAIVSCKSRKQDYTCSADEMYSVSHLYKAQREFFIKGYDDWYIISSKYGIIHPTQIIEPYDITLGAHSSNMTKNQTINTWDDDILDKIEKQIEWMVKKGWEIDIHTSRVYYNPLSDKVKNSTKYIKQPRGVNTVKGIYNNATKMLDDDSLEKCLEFISEKKQTTTQDTPKWWYHRDSEDFFGTSGELKKLYPEQMNEGGILRVSIGQFPQHRGWVIDKSLLDKLYQTDSGQWRIKKQK